MVYIHLGGKYIHPRLHLNRLALWCDRASGDQSQHVLYNGSQLVEDSLFFESYMKIEDNEWRNTLRTHQSQVPDSMQHFEVIYFMRGTLLVVGNFRRQGRAHAFFVTPERDAATFGGNVRPCAAFCMRMSVQK